jgi:hypothetical protein
VGYSEIPYLDEMAHQRCSKVERRVFVGATRGAGRGHRRVGGTGIDRGDERGAVNDQPSFSFP